MIRFVVGPEGDVVPDLARRLPGRGLWVKAERSAVERAVAKNLFARAARASVKPAADLAERVEWLLLERALADLGRARRAGRAVAGFVKVEQMVGRGRRGRWRRARQAQGHRSSDRPAGRRGGTGWNLRPRAGGLRGGRPRRCGRRLH